MTRARRHTRVQTPCMTITHAAGVLGNFAACIIHGYFNLMSAIRHNMPTPLKQDNWSGGDGENWMGRGHVHVCQCEFKSPQLCVAERGGPIPSATPVPPAALTDYYYGNPLAYASRNRLHARQGEVSSAPPRTSSPLLDFLVRWKSISVMGLCHMNIITRD